MITEENFKNEYKTYLEDNCENFIDTINYQDFKDNSIFLDCNYIEFIELLEEKYGKKAIEFFYDSKFGFSDKAMEIIREVKRNSEIFKKYDAKVEKLWDVYKKEVEEETREIIEKELEEEEYEEYEEYEECE